MTDTPSLLPQQVCPVTNGQQQQHLLPQALEPVCNSAGIMGERKGGARDQGPKATAFWNPGSKWHLLQLWPKREQVHLCDKLC